MGRDLKAFVGMVVMPTLIYVATVAIGIFVVVAIVRLIAVLYA